MKGIRVCCSILTMILAGFFSTALSETQTAEISPEILTPEAAEAASIIDTEKTEALAAVMRKAERKEPVTIAVIGGSITEGTVSYGKQDRAIRGRKPYAELFFDWWRQKFPETEFRFVNAGIGATNSYLGVHRVQRDVLDFRPDLVLVEFSVNDENNMKAKLAYDNLVRRILQDEAHPAVLLLFMAQTNGASAQVPHAAVGKHYGLPMISYKNTIERLMADGVCRAEDLSGDEVHPSALGHQIAGELIRQKLDEIYEVRNMTAEPEAFDAPPAVKEAYLNARIADSTNLIPDSCGTFRTDHRFARFPNGWRSENGKGCFVITETFANLGIVWLRQVSGECGQADVYVDGERKATLDGSFPGGWGDYAEVKEVFSTKTPAEHRVEIIIRDDSSAEAFEILGFLLSD